MGKVAQHRVIGMEKILKLEVLGVLAADQRSDLCILEVVKVALVHEWCAQAGVSAIGNGSVDTLEKGWRRGRGRAEDGHA